MWYHLKNTKITNILKRSDRSDHSYASILEAHMRAVWASTVSNPRQIHSLVLNAAYSAKRSLQPLTLFQSSWQVSLYSLPIIVKLSRRPSPILATDRESNSIVIERPVRSGCPTHAHLTWHWNWANLSFSPLNVDVFQYWKFLSSHRTWQISRVVLRSLANPCKLHTSG